MWVVLWMTLVTAHAVAMWGLWRLTGYWHGDDRALRRLCMICWLLVLLVLDSSIGASQSLVSVFARLVIQSQ